jgi:hypothetical protein
VGVKVDYRYNIGMICVLALIPPVNRIIEESMVMDKRGIDRCDISSQNQAEILCDVK